jgi:2-polyprenyl-3-methyl-5-hydroxy-6-metoxy-1,4-benzoquinol methylase
MMHAAGYRNARGIDVSEEQVARAHERGVEGFELADLRDHLSLARDTYDIILALDVFEHFEPEEVLALLDLIAGALKPGGTVARPNAERCEPFLRALSLRRLFGRYRYGEPHPWSGVHGAPPSSVRQALASTGFGHV